MVIAAVSWPPNKTPAARCRLQPANCHSVAGYGTVSRFVDYKTIATKRFFNLHLNTYVVSLQPI